MTRGVFFLASAIVITIVSFVSARPALAQSPQEPESFVEEVEGISATTVSVVFNVDEGKRVRVDESGNPIGFTTVSLLGESQRFQIVRASQSKFRLPEDIRSSLGLEIRVQMPVINVPFRLIFAHNPGVENGVTTERKNVVRFSVGRTF